MGKKGTYQTKLKWLAGGYAIALILCYTLGFRKTAQVYAEYNEKQKMNLSGQTEAVSMNMLTGKRLVLESMRKLYTTDTVVLDRQFLEKLDSCCKEFDLSLKEYKPIPSHEPGEKISTRMITVEGKFEDALKMVYVFEQKEQLCRVASVNFRKYIDNRDKKYRLACTMYVQNLMTHETP